VVDKRKQDQTLDKGGWAFWGGLCGVIVGLDPDIGDAGTVGVDGGCRLGISKKGRLT